MAEPATKFPTMITPRLRLRQFESKDDKGLHACLGNHDLVRYWDFAPCKNIQETRGWVRALAKTIQPYSAIAWAVADIQNDECIGMINYHHREAHSRRLEIGYILQADYHGRGLMTEAVQQMMTHCVDQLKTRRIAAIIHPDNDPSIRLATRLGFKLEGGPLRDYWRVGDRFMSPMLYSFIAV
ncbi:GNAT family N-acetyltransferase [Phyllobacterium sp. YR531]|uniref:GNAT family N-acetyltransferase n=1 Tax=Phyllobacterium sp. YR531 TaxID=1144343 RepID=UPI000593A630|nr:GNAT family N-acetyltransferase [Phyllobacterium sp. YR531]